MTSDLYKELHKDLPNQDRLKIEEKSEAKSKPKTKFERIKGSVDKLLNRKFKNKKVISQPRATVVIPAYKEEPYRSIYFKEGMKKARRDMFFT